ncbi:ribonuclease P protein component [Candidatus Peregrinibacteria bacterium]|jgi:ribonuclease P protein component|nr:ribonuclease P protein component [Candidatus Peregrinibacteria bacterium]MBT7736995.1 ribonuclease P protein component [Candidatus Peregrinibacteria bacterium]
MLPKEKRIGRGQIEFVLKKGESSTSKLFIIRYIGNNKEISRYAIVASAKLSKKAVERNRIRRQIYEAIRLIEKELTHNKSLDIVLIPKKQILKSEFEEIKEDLGGIIENHG